MSYVTKLGVLSAVRPSRPYTVHVSNLVFLSDAHDQGVERQRSTSAGGLEAARRRPAPPANTDKGPADEHGSGGITAGRARTAREAKLSAVEEAVLELVADGMTNAEIANALGKSPATVKAQVSSILRKLGVRNRSAAVAWWLRGGRGR